MTQVDTSNDNTQSGQENGTGNGTAATGMEALSQEAMQNFVSHMAAQNQALAAQLQQSNNAVTAIGMQRRQEQLATLTPEQKADELQRELDNIRGAAGQAYANQVSEDVWKRRDAEAAARMMRVAQVDLSHPQLYRGQWDQNWMPRLAASIEAIVAGRGTQTQESSSSSNSNGAANRANVGTGMGSGIPEIDPNADGPATIRFALQKLAEGKR